MKSLLTLCACSLACCLTLAVAVSLTGCPSAVPAIDQGATLALCILNTYSADKAAGESDAAATADTITKCATDAATVATTLDASHAAELKIGTAKAQGK